MTKRELLSALLCMAIGASTACSTPSPLSSAPPLIPPVPTGVETKLPAVEGLRALGGQLRAIPLRWQPVLAARVSGYIVERAYDAGSGFEPIARVEGPFSTVFIDEGNDLAAKAASDLGDGASYTYRVRAVTASGRVGPASTPSEASTTEAPARPQGFRAISQLPRRVALSWDPSTDPTVTGYRISRSPSALGEYRTLTSLEGRFSTTWVDEGLGDLRVFHYRVQAFNGAGGEGEPSVAQRAVTKPEPLPPDGLVAEPQGIGRNQLAWRPNVETDLAGYRIERSRDEETELVAELPAKATHFVDDGVGPGEVVAYRVAAFDRDGLSSPAAGPVDVASEAYGLVAEVTPDGVILSWAPPERSGLSETQIFQVTTLRRTEIGRAVGTRFRHRDPEPGSLRYQIVGLRPDGSTAPGSPVVEVEVLPTPAAPVSEPSASVRGSATEKAG